MKKSDLKYGNVVETRNGIKYLFHSINCDKLLELKSLGYVNLDYYNENLKFSNFYLNEFDIMKVYKDYTCQELLWERKEKPKLTEDEKVILRNLPKKRYEWIARDENGSIYLYKLKPNKGSYSWGMWGRVSLFPFDHLFNFIKWEDEEPYSIEDLLKGEEK